jgi:hypothetical protein
VSLGGRPVIVDLPQRLGSEGGKREPIVEFVLLEIGEGDEKELCQHRRVMVLGDAVPDLGDDVIYSIWVSVSTDSSGLAQQPIPHPIIY